MVGVEVDPSPDFRFPESFLVRTRSSARKKISSPSYVLFGELLASRGKAGAGPSPRRCNANKPLGEGGARSQNRVEGNRARDLVKAGWETYGHIVMNVLSGRPH
jgi:hypothetical protein